MNFEILYSAAQPIPIHAIVAIVALVMGGAQLALPAGTFIHRVFGYAWVACMLVVSLSSFFINETRWLGPFGPIHLLSIFVLISLWRGVSLARQGKITEHRKEMKQLYIFSLIIAGGFTLLPGRIMHSVLFG